MSTPLIQPLSNRRKVGFEASFISTDKSHVVCDHFTMSEYQELESEFLRLPTLKHIGMALLQFINPNECAHVRKDAFGVFSLGQVAFSFPKSNDRIVMHVKLDIKKVSLMDSRKLPLTEAPVFYVCDIEHPWQLGCAVRYIENAKDLFMGTRLTSSSPVDPTPN